MSVRFEWDSIVTIEWIIINFKRLLCIEKRPLFSDSNEYRLKLVSLRYLTLLFRQSIIK